MATKIKFKVNEDGMSMTRCPHGFVTRTTNRIRKVGYDCDYCKWKISKDYENKIVECAYEKPIKVRKNGRNL